jgi:hypothetical protein
MAVVAEIPALKFKLDAHALPSFGSYLPQGLAVREPRLNRFDQVAEFFGEHPKEKYDALLVDGFMAQPFLQELLYTYLYDSDKENLVVSQFEF